MSGVELQSHLPPKGTACRVIFFTAFPYERSRRRIAQGRVVST